MSNGKTKRKASSNSAQKLVNESSIASKKNKSFNKGISSNQKQLVVFLIKFFAIFAVATVLIELVNLSALNNLIAGITSQALGLSYAGNIITIGAQQFAVTNSCTGLVSASILGSIIFALRKPKFEIKLTLFIWGSIALLLANVPRVMLVLFAAKSGFDAELVHEFTWFLMSAIVLLIWYFGTKRITKIKEFNELV